MEQSRYRIGATQICAGRVATVQRGDVVASPLFQAEFEAGIVTPQLQKEGCSQ